MKNIADRFNLALVVVHHLKKGVESDVFNQISGSTGLSGAADCMMVLKRARMADEVTLSITGRDVEESELALRFFKDFCCFQLVGDAAEVRQSQERREVLDIFKNAGGPISSKEISNIIGKSPAAIRKMLSRLAGSGTIVALTPGKYVLQSVTPHNVTSHTSESHTSELDFLLS